MEACCVVIFAAIRNPTAAILAAVAVSLVAVPAGAGAPSPRTAALTQRTLTGHADQVRSVAFSPDGQTLASASYDKTIRLWDTATGRLQATLSGHTSRVLFVTFSPDGQTLASSGTDKTIRLWDVKTRRAQKTISANTWSVAFSPDGKTLAWAGADKTIKLVDATTGRPRTTLTGHTDGVEAVAFLPDGETLASSSKDGTVRLWDVKTREQRRILSGHARPVWFVAVSPDGKTLASASEDRTIRLWDVETGRHRATLTGHTAWVGRLAFSPDGKTLASSSGDKTLRLWDVQNARVRKSITAHGSDVRSAAFSPDGKTLASASADRTVKLWDVLAVLSAPTTNVGALPAPGRTPSTARGDTSNPTQQQALAQIQRLGGRLFTAPGGGRSSWAPDSARIVFSNDKSGLSILQVNTGEVSELVFPGNDPAWSPDGRQIAYVLGEGSKEEVWLIEPSGESPRRLADGGWPHWSADGRTLFFQSRGRGKVMAARLDGRQPQISEVFDTAWWYPAVSPDGRQVAHRCGSQLVVADRRTGVTLKTWYLPTSQGLLPAWSPDAALLAFGGRPSGDDLGVWVFDVGNGQAFRLAGGPLTAPAWSPDGSKLSLADRTQGNPGIWTLDTRALRGLGLASSVRLPPSGQTPQGPVMVLGRDGQPIGIKPPVYTPDAATRRFDPAPRTSYQSRVGRRGARRGGGAEFGVVCFGAIFLIVIVVALLFGASRSRNTNQAYAQLARRYGGTCNPGGLLARPKVQFPYAGTWVVVDVYSTGGKHPTYYTQVHFTLPQPGVRCEVYPERMWSRMGKLMGMEDVEIGSPAFDDRYIIKGSSPALLRNLLTPAVQHQIEQLRQFLGNGDVYVSFDRRELLVKKLSYIRDFRTLYQFTQLAIALYTQSVRPSDEGIEFVKDAAPPKLKEAVCQICGETIESDVVFCRRCRTPHHHDCWEYYGACSTYGCRETRYLRPESRRARRAQGSNRLPGKMRR